MESIGTGQKILTRFAMARSVTEKMKKKNQKERRSEEFGSAKRGDKLK